MAGEERWYFTKEQLNNSPSRRCGIDAEKELSYRQQGANLIQDMGQRLQVYPFVTVLTLATARMFRASIRYITLSRRCWLFPMSLEEC